MVAAKPCAVAGQGVVYAQSRDLLKKRSDQEEFHDCGYKQVELARLRLFSREVTGFLGWLILLDFGE
jgi:hypothetical protein